MSTSAADAALVAPGGVIGVLGGGQLGRMSILAGRRMGYRFVVLDPAAGCSAAAIADRHIVAPYDEPSALAALASQVEVVTMEFENIPHAAVSRLQERVPVHPAPDVLHICQNRAREKQFLAAHGLPCAPFAVVDSVATLAAALERIGYPAVLKTADFGYDGKGQRKLCGGEDLDEVWKPFAGRAAVVEGWVNFLGEYSLICGRNARAESCFYPLVHNCHRQHILFTSVSPVQLDASLEQSARKLGARLIDALQLVGVLAIELFLTESGWVVNELAPRPHNSGHLTMEAHATSQFEQHIRMVCGLPPGATDLIRPAAMLNLLGDLWRDGRAPDFARELTDPCCKLHLYDKGQPRPGRKMGHLTFVGATPQDCLQRALAAHSRLTGPTNAALAEATD